MNLQKILEEVKGAEGVVIGDYGYDKTLYVREDEVIRLILHFAYGIEYVKPEEMIEDCEEEGYEETK